MTWEYSEDNLIEQTAIDLLANQLGWDTVLAYNNESFGDDGSLGRSGKNEVLLRNIFLEKVNLSNIYKDGELDRGATVAKNATIQTEMETVKRFVISILNRNK